MSSITSKKKTLNSQNGQSELATGFYCSSIFGKFKLWTPQFLPIFEEMRDCRTSLHEWIYLLYFVTAKQDTNVQEQDRHSSCNVTNNSTLNPLQEGSKSVPRTANLHWLKFYDEHNDNPYITCRKHTLTYMANGTATPRQISITYYYYCKLM